MAFDGVELNETQRALLKAKELISDPERWCQGTFRSGLKLCTLGALDTINAASDAVNLKAFRCLNISAFELGYLYITKLNDSTDHSTVMAMFDRAIELAED